MSTWFMNDPWVPKLVSQKSEIIVFLGAGSHNGLSKTKFQLHVIKEGEGDPSTFVKSSTDNT